MLGPMALSDIDVSPAASGAGPSGSGRSFFRVRRNAVTAYAVFFGLWWHFIGLPTDTWLVGAFIWLGTIAWNVHQPWREHLRFARDWGPVLLFLWLYDLSRGAAYLVASTHVTEMIRADEAMFGQLPTVWLQQHFYDPHHVHWWDIAASLIYLSHFVTAFTVAAVLWVRNRELWAAFMRRWATLITAGLATYFLFPAAPPWWASQYHYIAEPVLRISNRGWDAIGMSPAGKLITAGQAMSNPVAAMPSLHSGFAMCVVAFFFLRVRKRWIPLLAAYPLAMAITLAYTGEHYMIDAFVGWSYVLAVFLVVGQAEKWWARRKAARAAAGPEDVVAAAEAVVAAAPHTRPAPAESGEPAVVHVPSQGGERSAAGGQPPGLPGPGDEQAEQR